MTWSRICLSETRKNPHIIHTNNGHTLKRNPIQNQIHVLQLYSDQSTKQQVQTTEAKKEGRKAPVHKFVDIRRERRKKIGIFKSGS